MFKCRNNIAPNYLTDLLPSTTSQRQQILVHSYAYPIAFSRTSLAKEGCFRFVRPSVWNSLPLYIKAEKDLANFKFFNFNIISLDSG